MSTESLFHSGALVFVIAAVTMLLRFLPFLIFRGKNGIPAYIQYLGEVLPPAMIGMLVIYCLKDVSLLTAPHGLPELLSTAAVVLLQIFRKNALLSILGGTLLYMLLLRLL